MANTKSRHPSTLRVLVVDDYPDGLDMVAEYLRFRDYSVHVAIGGEKAVEMARTIQPDIVLIDLSMCIATPFTAVWTRRSDGTTWSAAWAGGSSIAIERGCCARQGDGCAV